MASETFDFLVDRTVEQIWVWSDTIRLVIDVGDDGPAPSTYVDIGSRSELSDGAKRAMLDARDRPDEAGAVFRLLDRRIAGVVAVDGVLRLSFAGGAELTSLPDEQYESWTVVADGQVFQCMPGGVVDSW